jgi:hypothetical protein
MLASYRPTKGEAECRVCQVVKRMTLFAYDDDGRFGVTRHINLDVRCESGTTDEGDEVHIGDSEIEVSPYDHEGLDGQATQRITGLVQALDQTSNETPRSKVLGNLGKTSQYILPC